MSDEWVEMRDYADSKWKYLIKIQRHEIYAQKTISLAPV